MDDPDMYDSANEPAAIDTLDADPHGQISDTGACTGCGGDGWRGERVKCGKCQGRGYL